VRKEGQKEGETRVGRMVVCMVLTGEWVVVLMMEINACPCKQDRQQNTAATRILGICTTCNLNLRITWYYTLQRLRTFVQNTGRDEAQHKALLSWWQQRLSVIHPSIEPRVQGQCHYHITSASRVQQIRLSHKLLRGDPRPRSTTGCVKD
jgi:hypothetical protein